MSIFKLQFPNKESFICLFKTKNVAGLKKLKKNYKPQQQLKTFKNKKLVKKRQTNISGVFSLQQFQIIFRINKNKVIFP